MNLQTSLREHIENGVFASVVRPHIAPEALSIIRQDVGLHKYHKDPVGFGQDILGEHYTSEVKTLLESVRDYPVTIAVSATGTGKTHAAARAAAWFYKTQRQPKVFTAAAPPIDNLATLLWGEIGNIVRKHKRLFINDYITHLNISSAPPLSSIMDSMDAEENVSFIKGLTIPTSGSPAEREAKFSGKHAPSMLFIFDEGDAIPDEVYSGADGCMSGGFVRMLIMFNPKAKVGEAYRKIRDKLANVVYLSAFGHPNVISGEDVIEGAVTRAKTVQRICEWTRPLVEGETHDSECFKLPEFLIGEIGISDAGKEYPALKPGYYKIQNPAFSYKVLGNYPAKGTNQLISEEWINRARSRYDAYVSVYGEKPPIGTAAIQGVDVGEFGTDENISAFRYGGYLELVILPGDVDTLVTGDNATRENKKRNVSIAYVDATGVGTGVAPYMQREGCSASPVKVASSPTETTEEGEFKILRDQLWWSAREWLRTDPGAMLPPDELLIEELNTATYEVVNGKVRVMDSDTFRDLIKRSPDRASALIMTFAPGGFFGECDMT